MELLFIVALATIVILIGSMLSKWGPAWYDGTDD